VSVTGSGGLTLTTNDGGKRGILSFGPKGNVTFANLSSKLTINGASYKLINTVRGLAKAVAKNPTANFALAKSFDASGDGTYTAAPVQTTLNGSFEGLGNTISNLTIFDLSAADYVGLFAQANCGACNQVSVSPISVWSMSILMHRKTARM